MGLDSFTFHRRDSFKSLTSGGLNRGWPSLSAQTGRLGLKPLLELGLSLLNRNGIDIDQELKIAS